MEKPLRIFYLGPDWGTSKHRAQALRRLGHQVELVNPWSFLPQDPFIRRLLNKLVYEVGGRLLEPILRSTLSQRLKGQRYDVAWVDGGELIGPKTLRLLVKHAAKTINYNLDDPFGSRDRQRFVAYRQAVPYYDLLVVVREPNVHEAYQHGARRVLRVFRSADEVAHAPLALSETEQAKWRSEVVFVGTWMPERGPFLVRLLKLGVPSTIYGDCWHKAVEWPALKNAWVGPNLVGEHYVKAIQSSKVCLGLLSEGNRDLHTTRSAEIPYIGSVLCARRTVEHEAMYRENQDAVFWDTPEECAEKCLWLLSDPDVRERIAGAGRARCIANGTLNEVVARQVLDSVVARESEVVK